MSVVEVVAAQLARRVVAPTGARGYNRRITAVTPFVLTGPAAGSPLLRTRRTRAGKVSLGTLNNCAGGVTPWGTVLSGEENFNRYFAAPAPPPTQVAGRLRALRHQGPGTPAGGSRVDPRFEHGARSRTSRTASAGSWRSTRTTRRPRRASTRRSAAFKHEGANISIARDGRVVAYTGDDERFDYLYKFVSEEDDAAAAARVRRAKHNMTLLEEGDLYVARFSGDAAGSPPSYDGFDGTVDPADQGRDSPWSRA